LTSSFGIILLALALLGITLGRKFEAQLGMAQGCEWFICAVIAVSYIWFVRLTYRFEHPDRVAGEPMGGATTRTPWLGRKIAVIAAALVVSAWWLTKTGDVLAVHPIEALGRPLGASFVGAAFLALATSLPEVVTCLAAIKLGHLDMALGNIFGSNMFNILVVPMLKVVSVIAGAPLLMGGTNFNDLEATVTGLLPILLTGMTVAGLTYRTKRRVLRFGFDSVLLALAYALGMYVVFSNSG
jgi:cation:H+ antiporter